MVIAAGTYDGVLAGWELDGGSTTGDSKLKIRFAAPVHDGSVRSLALNTAASPVKRSDGKKKNDGGKETAESVEEVALSPGLLLSTGFDDMLRLHDFSRSLTGSGEIRTPSEFGTPLVAALAPPSRATHCLVGFASGKLLIYSLKGWTVQHVLPGHSSSKTSDGGSTCGVASLSVHPSGKLALSGGTNDGKLMLWDLTRGRLAHVSKVTTRTSTSARKHNETVTNIVWGRRKIGRESEEEHEVYGFCYGSHVTVRDVATGRDLLDVELPSRANQICLLSNPAGLFVVAACNDGSLPVLVVEDEKVTSKGRDDDETRGKSSGRTTRRAIMAIEPVDTTGQDCHTAGEERFKCVQAVSPYHVVTANSAGVVSLMNLTGAINILQSADEEDYDDENDAPECDSDGEPVEKSRRDDSDSDEEELAVDILDSIQLGTGARITCLVAWATVAADKDRAGKDRQDETNAPQIGHEDDKAAKGNPDPSSKRKRAEVELDATTLDKARKLVSQAKKIQKRKQKKKKQCSDE